MSDKVKKSSLFHFGVAFYCFVLMFLMFAIIKSLHSMFLVPVTESLGLQRSAFSLVFTIAGVSLAVVLPITTKLLKKYPTRWIICISILMSAGGFASFAFAKSIWQFYILAMIVGAGTSGCTNMVASLLINNWFIHKKGSVLAIAFTGSGFGAAVLSPALTWIMGAFGWQAAYIFSGILMAAVCLPLTVLFGYQKPSEKGMQPYREKNGDETVEHTGTVQENCGGALLENIRCKTFFWVYFLCLSCWALAIGGIHSHIAAYLTDQGHSAEFVAMIYSMMAIFIICGKILAGIIYDKKGIRIEILFLTVTLALALICLLAGKNPVMAILFAFFYGGGTTFSSVAAPYFTGSFYGQRDYASILSISNIAVVIGAAVGPFLSGKVFDITGGYQIIFTVYLILLVIAAMILYLLKNYLDKRYQAQWMKEE